MTKKKVEVKEPTNLSLYTVVIEGVDKEYNKELCERLKVMDPKFNYYVGGYGELEVLNRKNKLNINYLTPLQDVLYLFVTCSEEEFKVKNNEKETKFTSKDIKLFEEVYEEMGKNNYLVAQANSTLVPMNTIATFVIEQINKLSNQVIKNALNKTVEKAEEENKIEEK